MFLHRASVFLTSALLCPKPPHAAIFFHINQLVEHRMFSFISMNWKGIPLISVALILSLIGATTTDMGLSIRCVLDESTYKKGIKVSDDQFSAINIVEDDFHGDWNYTISPNHH